MAATILTALYLRASSREQTESIESQRMLLERYAKDHGLEIGPQYEDFAISGDSCNGRPGLQSLLADAKAGKFQAVLVRQLSRLSRRDSLKSAAQIVGPLLDAGVTIYTASHGDLKLDSATGRIMLAVISEFDHSENVSRSLNVLNGQLRAATKGSWIGSAPYAYRIEGTTHAKVLVLDDPREVTTVRHIFEQYAAGETCENIARGLNAEGIPAPYGGGWRRETIGDILARPVYVGDHRFNNVSCGKYYHLTDGKPAERRGHWVDDDQERARAIKNTSDNWIYIRDRWPAIVDRELWDRAQARLAKNAKHKSPSLNNFIFSGMLRCSCGAKWNLSGRHNKGRNSYQCHECGAVVAERQLLAAIANTIEQSLTPDAIEGLRRQLESKVSKPAKPAANIKTLETKLAKYERRLLECSADMVATVEKEIRTLRRSIEEARRQARSATERPAGDVVEHCLAQLFRLPEMLASDDPKRLKANIETIFGSVRVQATSRGTGTGRRWTLVDGEAVLSVGLGVEVGSRTLVAAVRERSLGH